MTRSTAIYGAIGVALLLLLGGGLISHLVATDPVTSQAPVYIPTPIGGIGVATETAPTPTPDPMEQEVLNLAAQPPQHVVVSPPRLLGTPETPTLHQTTPYTLRTDTDQRLPRLYLHHTTTGEEIQLGDDMSLAMPGAINDTFVLWGYQCYEKCAETEQAPGLHVYDLRDHTQQLVSTEAMGVHGYAELVNHWVVYLSQKSLQARKELRVHNLLTGEEWVIDDHWQAQQGRSPGVSSGNYRPNRFYALGDEYVVWANGSIQVSDLATQETRTLDLPDAVLDLPNDVSVSGDIVVWYSFFHWWGYHLEYEELFAFSDIPPGWEHLDTRMQELVTVEDGELTWSLLVNDEEYLFGATITTTP